MSPRKISFGDVGLGWDTPKILPLILEAVPRNPVSLAKLLVFWFCYALVFAGVWHYLGVLIQIYHVTSRELHMNLDHHDPSRFEKLLGRGDR